MYQVNIAAQGNARSVAGDVLRLNVRGADGQMVPFGSFAQVEPVMGSASISRYNMYETASLTATPAHGISSSTAIDVMEKS